MTRTVGGLTAVRMMNSGLYDVVEQIEGGAPVLLRHREVKETVAVDPDKVH